MDNTVKIVAGYIRVSTQEQSTKGLSLESQKQYIEEYCRQKGWKLYDLYVDAGITARKQLYKREAFMRMMEDVRCHNVNHIVVLRLDRFFRNVYDYHRMMNEYLIPNRCEWSAINEQYDTTTTNGRLMINLRLSIAEQECDQDSDRIKDVFANRVKEGYVITGITPIGYKVENKRLVPSDKADLVRDIFDTFIRLNSIRLVMLDINKRYGERFSYTVINRTLRKDIYIGRFRDNDHYCEPIIDRETFDTVQSRLDSNIRARSEYKCYIFSGLLTCAKCGRRLCGSSPNKYRKGVTPYHYYRCGGAYQDLTCDNRRNTVESKIEEYLVNNVEALLRDYIVTIEARDANAKPIKGNRAQVEAKIRKLNELFINDYISMEEYNTRRAELEASIVEDQIPKKKDLSSLQAFLNSGFRGIYNDLTPQERQSLWRSVIKEIIVSSNQVESVIFL